MVKVVVAEADTYDEQMVDLAMKEVLNGIWRYIRVHRVT